MKKQPQKGAGRHASGNVTVDLGEAIDKKLRSALGSDGKKAEIGRPGRHEYRPGMYGGYRPWYADRPNRFGGTLGRWGLGQDGPAPLGMLRSMNTVQMLTGAAVGVIGNRALMRVTPDIIKTDSGLAHSAIAFVVGLIPVLVKQNSTTLGVAVPGAVYLAGSLVDWALDSVGIRKPALRGAEGAPRRMDAVLAARERLAGVQGRMQPVQRAVARQYA